MQLKGYQPLRVVPNPQRAEPEINDLAYLRQPYRAKLREKSPNDGSDGEAGEDDGAPLNYERSNAGASLPRNTNAANIAAVNSNADLLNDWKNFRETVRGNISKAEAGSAIAI